MKFAFSSNAFRRFDLAGAIEIIAACGYEGIEVMADIPHAYPGHLTDKEVEEIRKKLSLHRLEISNINAFMHHADGDTYHPTWIERDPALRAKRIGYTLRCIALAEKLGVGTLSTEPGGPLDGMTREEGLSLFKEGLHAIEKEARDKRVKVLIEPEPGLLIENSTQFLSFVGALDPEIFGLNFDIGHFFCVGEDPCALIRGLKEYIHHFHLEDIASSREHHHLMLGHGAIDLPRVLKAIDDIDYKGFVTVELYTYEDRPAEAALEAFKYLQEWSDERKRGPGKEGGT